MPNDGSNTVTVFPVAIKYPNNKVFVFHVRIHEYAVLIWFLSIMTIRLLHKSIQTT